jgi:photosystem II stability/assembly factor-like uncharacterized protein
MPIPFLNPSTDRRRALHAVMLALIAICGGHKASGAETTGRWTQCGWGGGGFYYSAVFHPTQDGVIYLGGDVGGVYKTEDHGRHWRMINNGLAGYGVFSLAVDRMNPQTVYAATDDGLCKSIDAGEHWQLLPRTGRKELRITGEKGRSIRSIAVDPTNGSVVYAGSPAGKVYKSTDGGQTWNAVYSKEGEAANPSLLRVQYGKVNDQYFGGFWLPLKFPENAKAADCVGFGFQFQGDKSTPKDVFLTLKTTSGISYRSKNLRDLFADDQLRDVLLKTADFAVDPEFAQKHPEQARTALDWATVNRMDFASSGPLPQNAHVAKIGSLAFAFTGGTPGKPARTVVMDFAKNKTVQTYGNIRIGDAAAGSVHSVAVSAKMPLLVAAATADAGLVISEDGGKTWRALETPKRAANVTFDPANPSIIYGSFFKDGIWKSTNRGKTWTRISQDFSKEISIVEVAVSPANSLDVCAIGEVNWGGNFYASSDGGQTWKKSAKIAIDFDVNPTMQAQDKGSASISSPTNITIGPRNPKEIFVSANWRPCLSEDGGQTWTERVRGADISCITDIRFKGKRTYVTVMDEGTLMSENDGATWKQLWPRSYQGDLSGHNWRVAVTENNGADRIIATDSPWGADTNLAIVSEDGGKTYKTSKAGLPATRPRANTMWGQGYARALAVDPANPKIAYLGIDGDPAGENSGGGVFKSEDGGSTWKQLANQPASRRMFFGLAVDPTDSKRVYWGACGAGGGVHRSDDGGATWKQVFSNEQWIFNLHVAADGTVYCPGANLWRSTDHGQTWKQLTKFNNGRTIIGLETDPRDPKTIWISTCTWDNSANGAIYKTTDGGVTWEEITGNIPYRKPMVLRFNPTTRELWAGGVGLYKMKQ